MKLGTPNWGKLDPINQNPDMALNELHRKLEELKKEWRSSLDEDRVEELEYLINETQQEIENY